jgi:hypothetical protein
LAPTQPQINPIKIKLEKQSNRESQQQPKLRAKQGLGWRSASALRPQGQKPSYQETFSGEKKV